MCSSVRTRQFLRIAWAIICVGAVLWLLWSLFLWYVMGAERVERRQGDGDLDRRGRAARVPHGGGAGDD